MDVGSSVSQLVLVDVGAPVLEDVHSFSSAVVGRMAWAVALLSVRLKIK